MPFRYNRMCGKMTLWNPGCDHAGIATQVHYPLVSSNYLDLATFLWIRIRTYGFGSPGSGSIIICTDPDLDSDSDPSIIKQK